MADRARLATATQTLREVRDDIERMNDPHDPRLGDIHVRLAIIIGDLRNLPYNSPVMMRGDLSS